jgi:colanic acid biosynthesis glycosyl transferase WcaI
MGGGATRAHNLAKGLSVMGYDVTVVTAFPHYPTGNIPKKYRKKLLSIEYENKVKIIRTFVPPIASKGLRNRILLFASFIVSSLFALPIVRETNAVYASNPNIIAMFPSIAYKTLCACPVIQNVDDLWPEVLFDLGIKKQSVLKEIGEVSANLTYNLASAITPISKAYVPVINQKYGVNNKKIFIVPAGVDFSMFSNQTYHSKSTDNRQFTVLYIGALSPAYDFDQVLRAARWLTKTDVKIVIQGGGELAEPVRTKIKKSGLANVVLINKIVDRAEVAQILQSADALLLPLNGAGSIELGISSKLYEYQAAGKPILCCSNGQSGRYVSQTRSGIVIKPGDHENLATAILALKDNPEQASILGQNGKRYAESEVSIPAVGKKKWFQCLNL